jgi:hypothetical protein
MGDGDAIEVSLNGSALDSGDAKTSTDGWTRDAYPPDWNRFPTQVTTATEAGTVIEWTLDAPPLKKGVNQIAVRLVQADASREGEVILADVRVSVTYS